MSKKLLIAILLTIVVQNAIFLDQLAIDLPAINPGPTRTPTPAPTAINTA